MNTNPGARSRERRRGRNRYCSFDEAKVQPAIGIGKVVAELTRKLGLEGQVWLQQLQTDWTRVVGAAVAKHTRPGRFDGRALSVYVDSAVWLNELKRYGQAQMLANLQREFPKIQALRLEPDPGN